jgi:hypothetical protein
MGGMGQTRLNRVLRNEVQSNKHVAHAVRAALSLEVASLLCFLQPT